MHPGGRPLPGKITTVAPDLSALLDSWLVHLRAERKSPSTIRSYRDGVRQFLAWCAAQDVPAVLDRPTVRAWVAGLLDDGAEANTARSRQAALRRFSAWLAEEDEIDRDELLGLKPPQLDVKHTDRLTDAQCDDLVKACAGKDFRDRRDTAVLRLMIETGARAGEVVAMGTADVDITRLVAVIRRGKGGRARSVPFSAKTGAAIDRYQRIRGRHRLADTPALWLGEGGKTWGYPGLYRALNRRAEEAGIKDFYPHLLRHTGASRFLAAGGTEGALMALAGWRDRSMIDRYTRSTAADRMIDEARGLNLGDFG